MKKRNKKSNTLSFSLSIILFSLRITSICKIKMKRSEREWEEKNCIKSITQSLAPSLKVNHFMKWFVVIGVVKGEK